MRRRRRGENGRQDADGRTHPRGEASGGPPPLVSDCPGGRHELTLAMRGARRVCRSADIQRAAPVEMLDVSPPGRGG
ncbi:hypothetical protein GCM10022226_77760 [Sphaerisporangium flaviroseum]|uniref:Uncharacterized protein n=1 Tax=Sphaerisporangium flaviroseum TaxID=509199 RepID=A0ABP7JFK7_9ACTN